MCAKSSTQSVSVVAADSVLTDSKLHQLRRLNKLQAASRQAWAFAEAAHTLRAWGSMMLGWLDVYREPCGGQLLAIGGAVHVVLAPMLLQPASGRAQGLLECASPVRTCILVVSDAWQCQLGMCLHSGTLKC